MINFSYYEYSIINPKSTTIFQFGTVSRCEIPDSAIEKFKSVYNINKPIIRESVAAVSAGIINSQPYLDLNYEEDVKAEVDANFVICESEKIVEIQATGEEHSFTNEQFQQIFTLSKAGISQIIKKQKEVLNI